MLRGNNDGFKTKLPELHCFHFENLNIRLVSYCILINFLGYSYYDFPVLGILLVILIIGMNSDDTTLLEPSQKKSCEDTSLVELFTDEIAVAKLHLTNDSQQSSSKDDEVYNSKVHFSGHRAGFDAFMTAYTFAVYLCKRKTKSSHAEVAKSHLAEMESIKNKIVMSGKPVPLLVAKSHFAKTSHGHQLRMTGLLKHNSVSTSTDQNNDK